MVRMLLAITNGGTYWPHARLDTVRLLTSECVVNSSMGLFGPCITQTVLRSKTSCWGLNENHLVKFISTFIISTLCTASFHWTRSPMCLADIRVFDWPHIATCLTELINSDIRQVTDNKCTGKLIDQQYYTHSGKVCEPSVLQPRPQYINFINLPFRFNNTVYPWGVQCVFVSNKYSSCGMFVLFYKKNTY